MSSHEHRWESLLAPLTDVLTPAGLTPRQLQSGLVQIEATKERRDRCQGNGLISKA
jgi:hypothetical protein